MSHRVGLQDVISAVLSIPLLSDPVESHTFQLAALKACSGRDSNEVIPACQFPALLGKPVLQTRGLTECIWSVYGVRLELISRSGSGTKGN